MGLILGYISLICFILLALKFVSRKFGLKKLITTLMKLHKPVSVYLRDIVKIAKMIFTIFLVYLPSPYIF